MNGTLYYDEIEGIWYVNWLRESTLFPSVAVSGRVKLGATSVVELDLKGISSGDDVMYIEEDGYARLINSVDDLTLYSQIEHLIINWDINGTKTAGHLTRQIMKLIEKQK